MKWVPQTFAICFWFAPLVGYIAALYCSQLCARQPQIIRALILTILSLVLTVGGGVAEFLSLPLIGISLMDK
jgi:hypothetical protein